MKKILIVMLTICGLQLQAKEVELQYEIVSDEKKEHVIDGFCEIIGTTKESGWPLARIGVKSLDKKHTTTSDKNGAFRLVMPAKVTQVYAYHFDYGEIVIDEYDFKSGHQVKIEFNLYRSKNYEVEKPVIYVYGDEGEKIHIEIEAKGKMDFSYPTYDQGWDIVLAEHGNLMHNGASYPYLFWDGKQHLKFTRTNNKLDGWLITKEKVVAFLESTLSVYGLNSRESADFITYWAPRMIQYDQVFVQFLLDENYNEVASLNMTPKPESSKRIYMKFANGTNLNQSDVAPQKLVEFNRQGLTYVEWGGSELNPVRLREEVEVYVDGKRIFVD